MLPSKGNNILPNKHFTNIKTTVTKTVNLYANNKLSFFNTDPVEQQSIDYSIESIVDALKAYGLASENSQWFLQEGPFNGTDMTIPYTTYQGFSVDISEDGTTAVVGGPGSNINEIPEYHNTGAAWIFVKNSHNIWKQQQTLIPLDALGTKTSFGWDVSISNDGNTVAIGGPGDEPIASPRTGATWVYTRTDGVWTQQAKLLGSMAVYDSQGYSVSLSGDGNTLIVGAPGSAGSILVFVRDDGIWTQQAGPITPVLVPYTIFLSYIGRNISTSDDGNTFATTGLVSEEDGPVLWVYVRSDGIWTQQYAEKIFSEFFTDSSISISGDGNTIAVGTRSFIRIYVKIDNTWVFQQSLIGTGDYFSQGQTVSLSNDGNTITFTGYTNTVGSFMWIFNRVGTLWSQNGTEIEIGKSFSTEISSDGKTAIVGQLDDNSVVIYQN